MENTNPTWYEELRGNPLKSKTFTTELKHKILIQTEATILKKRRSFHFAIIGASLLCISSILVAINLLFTDSQQQVNPTPEPSQVIHGNGGEDQEERDTEELDAKAEEAQEEYEPVKLLEHQFAGEIPESFLEYDFMTAIDERNKRNSISQNEFIFMQPLHEDKMLVFINIIFEYPQYNVSVNSLGTSIFTYDSVKKDWTYSTSFSYTIDSFETTSRDKLKHTWWADDGGPPIFVGAILDQNITEIEFMDEDHIIYPARIFPEEHGSTPWLAILPERNKTYTLVAKNDEGNTLEEIPYYVK